MTTYLKLCDFLFVSSYRLAQTFPIFRQLTDPPSDLFQLLQETLVILLQSLLLSYSLLSSLDLLR